MRLACCFSLVWLLVWPYPKEVVDSIAARDDYESVVFVVVPPGRNVVVERRKMDWSRNLPITVNRTDTVIVNGVVR